MLTSLDLSQNTKFSTKPLGTQKISKECSVANNEYYFDVSSIIDTSTITDITVGNGGTYNKSGGYATIPFGGSMPAKINLSVSTGAPNSATLPIEISLYFNKLSLSALNFDYSAPSDLTYDGTAK